MITATELFRMKGMLQKVIPKCQAGFSDRNGVIITDFPIIHRAVARREIMAEGTVEAGPNGTKSKGMSLGKSKGFFHLLYEPKTDQNESNPGIPKFRTVRHICGFYSADILRYWQGISDYKSPDFPGILFSYHRIGRGCDPQKNLRISNLR